LIATIVPLAVAAPPPDPDVASLEVVSALEAGALDEAAADVVVAAAAVVAVVLPLELLSSLPHAASRVMVASAPIRGE
jgi:hypothetical protein